MVFARGGFPRLRSCVPGEKPPYPVRINGTEYGGFRMMMGQFQ